VDDGELVVSYQSAVRSDCSELKLGVVAFCGLSYRLIARNVGLSKNTVMDIVRRNSAD
jgi:hypothetical protein